MLDRSFAIILAFLIQLLPTPMAQAQEGSSRQENSTNSSQIVGGSYNNVTINPAPISPLIAFDARILECIAKEYSRIEMVLQIGPPFPLFSDELSPRSQFPDRVVADGQAFDQEIRSTITPAVVAEVASKVKQGSENDYSIEGFGTQYSEIYGTYETLRYWFLYHNQDYNSLASKYGVQVEQAFHTLEEARNAFASTFPNRVLIVRFRNDGSQPAMDLQFLVTTAYPLYDAMVADEQYKVGENDRRLLVKIAVLPPGKVTEARIWYHWRPLKDRDSLFLDEDDFRWATTEGITVTDIVLGTGHLKKTALDFDDLRASRPLNADPTRMSSAGSIIGGRAADNGENAAPNTSMPRPSPKGAVTWFNNAEGFGFVNQDSEGSDVFAHHNAIQGDGFQSLQSGPSLEFDVNSPRMNLKDGVGVSPLR